MVFWVFSVKNPRFLHIDRINNTVSENFRHCCRFLLLKDPLLKESQIVHPSHRRNLHRIISVYKLIGGLLQDMELVARFNVYVLPSESRCSLNRSFPFRCALAAMDTSNHATIRRVLMQQCYILFSALSWVQAEVTNPWVVIYLLNNINWLYFQDLKDSLIWKIG